MKKVYGNTRAPAKASQRSNFAEAALSAIQLPESGGAREVVKANTEDAGVELTYNRRNRRRGGLKWSELKGKNQTLRVSETKKSNVYARPDYEKLVAGGMNPLAAHLVKQVYDAIAATPRTRTAPTDENLKTYITAVNRMMDGVMKWANDPLAVAKWAGVYARVGEDRCNDRFTCSYNPREKQVKFIADYVYPDDCYNHRDELMVVGGQKALDAMYPKYDEAKRARWALEDGWPAKQEARENRIEARIVQVRARNVSGAKPDAPQYRWVVYADGSRQFLAKNHPAGGFATQDEATAWARRRSKRGTKSGTSDKGISVGMAQREGPARRMEGEDIDSDRLKETFGFKGVNFGTWMKGDSNKAERQLHLNHAYDAFMDLAEILGVPPRAMSLNGMMGIAFGAQGGAGGAAAHFVPGANEINLTRTSGAGSLAHEWGHGLDHYFATQAGLAGRKKPFLTEHLTGGDGIRPEIVERFAAIVTAMNLKSETPDQVKIRLEGWRAEVASLVNGWLAAVKRRFMAWRVDEAAFDKLAERIRELDLGDGKVAAGRARLSPAVAELRKLYKDKTGRTYSLNDIKGLQSCVDRFEILTSECSAEVSNVPQQVTSDFATYAAALDKHKGAQGYWNTSREKFARAFDAFVSDSLAEKAAKNSYLSHAGRQDVTTPRGEERKAINQEFRALADALETREADGSVAMF